MPLMPTFPSWRKLLLVWCLLAPTFAYRLSEPTLSKSCIITRYLRQTVFEGGPYFVDESFYCSLLTPSPEDITLVTQFTLDRIDKFVRLTRTWNGPISATIVIGRDEHKEEDGPFRESKVFKAFASELDWSVLFWTDLHLLWNNDKGRYPINVARNIAIDRVRTKRMFLLDVDFFPHPQIREFLASGVINSELKLTSAKTLLVLPAFEYPDKKWKKVYMPETKQEMQALFQSKELVPFHLQNCPGCHRPTDFPKWFQANQKAAYPVMYRKLFEPYVIGSSGMAKFDERFADYGKNKVELYYQLHLEGYQFRVLPYPFYVIHENHKETEWRLQFLDDKSGLRNATADLWDEFTAALDNINSLPDTARTVLESNEATARAVSRAKLSALESSVGERIQRIAELEQRVQHLQMSLDLADCRLSSTRATQQSAIENSARAKSIVGVTSAFRFPKLKQAHHTPMIIAAPMSLLILFFVIAAALYLGPMCFRKCPKKFRAWRPLLLIFAGCIAVTQYWALTPQARIGEPSQPPTLVVPAILDQPLQYSSSDSIDVTPDYRLQVAWKTNEWLKAREKFGHFLRQPPRADSSPLEATYSRALSELIRRADESLSKPIRTVMDKLDTSPSGDKHDFFTRTFYRPEKDGEMHPDVFSPKFDKAALWDLEASCIDLALAYFWSGQLHYAERLAEMVKAWFLDPQTKMNPHFIYASLDVDTNARVGRQYGLVEAHPFRSILESVAVIASSPYWSPQDTALLREWFSDLTLWFLTHDFGHAEEKSGNNHQTGYYVNLNHFFYFTGDIQASQRLMTVARHKMLNQINSRGEQHRETARPDAWWYVGYNIYFLIELAEMCERVGTPLWNLTSESQSIVSALDWIIPRALGEKDFAFGTHQLTKTDLILAILPALRRAANALSEPKYEVASDRLIQLFQLELQAAQAPYQLLFPRRYM